MLITHHERPRELKWYHAGPLLYGDLGTSRFYVLGLAFYYALYSSLWYILAVGLLVMAVGWAYTVVCRVYPDGGGVYSAARQISPVLSVIGALLLFADYAVTAALSAFDGMHYFGLTSDRSIQIGACTAIVILGVINYIGPKRAGTFALLVALATLFLTVILVGFSIPHLGAGVAQMKPMLGDAAHRQTMAHGWATFVGVVLALSGIEAVANMTGIMVKPVDKTSKKSIWPVLAEVVIFNVVLGIAMLALPAALANSPGHRADEFKQPAASYAQDGDKKIEEYRRAHPDYDKSSGKGAYDAFDAGLKEPHSSPNEEDVKNKVLRVMAEQFVHPWFGVIAGFVFGLLLISAVNTVIGGMISVAYVMSRDQELPRFFNKLNIFGVPWVGLIPALAVPCILLALFTNIEELADLYAIGVVGAIAINLTCCTINAKLPIKTWERLAIGVLAAIMLAIELTLAVQKWHALVFVTIILAVGMGARLFTKWYLPARARMKRPPTKEELTTGRYRGAEIHVEPPVAPALAPAGPTLESFATPAAELDLARPHILVATRGGQRLLDFAVSYTKQINGVLFVIYVRQLNLQFGPQRTPTFEEDKAAQETFAAAFLAAKTRGVQMVPLYVVSSDVADSILDFAATYGVSALLMGVSRTGAVLRALKGDVLTAVADNLPPDIPLLIHA
jgi:amino acid transporter